MSSVPRFFYSGHISAGDTISLSMEDSYHASKVLRLKKGDSAEICDGREKVFAAHAISPDKAEFIFFLTDEITEKRESPIQITLFQGLLKGKKMDTVVQQAVECGVSHVVPLVTKRSVSLIKDSDHAADKTERWQKIAASAASLSRRGRIPKVSEPIPIANILSPEITGKGLNLFFWEKVTGKTLPVKQCREILSETSQVNIIIGPEGGFEDSEADLLRLSGNNFILAGLGPRILRAETAATAAIILTQSILGDLQGD